MSTTYQQAPIPVSDPSTFDTVRSAIDKSFSNAGVENFLRSVEKKKLRIREFEGLLKAGLLGADAAAGYARLNPADQGMIRELFLASLEKVPVALRDKYFRIYAYY